jgi:hypothetical protein
MTATLLVILGGLGAVTVVAVWVTSLLHRSHRKFSFAGQASPHLHQPAFMVAKLGERRAPTQASTWWVSGLTKTEAEDCLDWLEANGYTQREVALKGDGFAIRFK